MNTLKTRDNDWSAQKVPTQIIGLDRLLHGGFDLSRPHTMIVIKGGEKTEKTLLGLQMVYGLAQSLTQISRNSRPKGNYNEYEPYFISGNHDVETLNDLLLDVFFSSCIQKIIANAAASKDSEKFNSNTFTKLFFDTTQILCQNNISVEEAVFPLDEIKRKTDELISKEIIYYNNRTNALHFRTSQNRDDRHNILYERAEDSINNYWNKFQKTGQCNNISEKLHSLTGFYLLKAHITDLKLGVHLHFPSQCDLLAIDLNKLATTSARKLANWMEQMKKNAKVSILIVNEEANIPDWMADVIIHLTETTDQGYLLRHISIDKNSLQDSAIGSHQYKRRDCGIEIYPSLHLIFQQRRYLQRALVYTHSDVITDTYQQYLKRQNYYGLKEKSYTYYIKEINSSPNRYLKSLYPKYFMDFISIDLLDRIFLPSSTKYNRPKDEEEMLLTKEFMYGNSCAVTGIIGAANTYKRFLTFGSLFSSTLAHEHTLILLLNKEEAVIRRRLTCPARMNGRCNREECPNCYRYIHFMNICMGCITPEELIYFLERQIEVTYDGEEKKQIRRIIVDDLQALDFCFPLLKDNGLFLSALMTLCREHNILLYMLCDRESGLTDALRALADNVICTDKDKDGHPLIYVERFAGYNNTPSKMYCGRIENIDKLFRCYEQYDSDDNKKLLFGLDGSEIKDKPVSSMEIYWKQ